MEKKERPFLIASEFKVSIKRLLVLEICIWNEAPFSEYIVKTLKILEVTISYSHELEDDHYVGRNRYIDER